MLSKFDRQEAENHVRLALKHLGHDLEREGLKDTPRRVVKHWEEFCTSEPFNFTTFDSEGCDEMIIQSGIPVMSLCEHHLLPFTGTAVVGYIPEGRIVGLSKLARTVNFFCRRFQNQERITREVAQYLSRQLGCASVGVHICAEHTCMTIRGAQAPGTKTSTVCLLGAMRLDAATRAEFLSHVK